MKNRRVVITGLAAVTPVGNTFESTWNNLLEGQGGIGMITRFDTSQFPVHIGAEIKGFDVSQFVDKKDEKRMDPFSSLAVACADMCIQDAKLDVEKTDKTRFGAIIGSGIGGLQEIEEQHTKAITKGFMRVSPFYVPKMMINSASGNVAIRFGLQGPNFGIVSACASANHSIGTVYRFMKYGDADLMLVGGSEKALTPSGLAGFCAARALSTRNEEPDKACRPFDKDRDGFVLGEGGAVLLFEELEHALARGAKIYAEVLGMGMTCDAYHITAPLENGGQIARAMELALKDGNIDKSRVGYINAHGTSTQLNDVIETRAIKTVFGDDTKVPVNSTK